jgi:hypothetical protein
MLIRRGIRQSTAKSEAVHSAGKLLLAETALLERAPQHPARLIDRPTPAALHRRKPVVRWITYHPSPFGYIIDEHPFVQSILINRLIISTA